MIEIASDRLVVEMLEPGSEIYARTRFDWTGFITQVTLDGSHTFCVPESLITGQGTGGIGLCSEFGSSMPVGYDDARPGDKFPKIGVGVLERVDESEYSPFYPYPNTPFPIRVETEGAAATFTVDPVAVRGYAVRLTKRVEVVDNQLCVRSRLQNVGEKRIVTQEYNHNFVGIDNAPFGPDYALHFPFDVVSEAGIEIPCAINGDDITWSSAPQQAYCCSLSGFEGRRTPYWELSLKSVGAAMREQTDFDWARCIFFGTPHLVSAEVFVDIDIAPDQAQEWTREYSFSARR